MTDLIRAWVSSLRLKTLPLGCCGIVVGNALAIAYQGSMSVVIGVCSLLTAISLQIMSNLANDYGDMSKGSDTQQRIGPKRGMQYGLINFKQMKIAIILLAMLSLFFGIALIVLACRTLVDVMVFVLLGLLSIIAAICYTVGRKAYGYYGLGDLAVLLFFGYVSVMGSFFLQTHVVSWFAFIPATACGLLGVVVLNVNNMRDIEEDKLHGKQTIAVRLGFKKVRYYHLFLLGASLLFLILFGLIYGMGNPYIWLFLLAVPLMLKSGYSVWRYPQAEFLQQQLVVAVKINVLTLSLFSIGLILG